MIKTAPTQRIGQFSGGIRGEHDARDRHRLDRSKLRNADLKIGEEFKQKSLELLVGTVNFVDQQDRRLVATDSREERTFQEIFFGKNVLLDGIGIFANALARFDGEELTLLIPLVKSGVLIEPLVTLQADQFGAVHGGKRFANFCLADSGFTLEQKRPFEEAHQPQRGGYVVISDIANGSKLVCDFFALQRHSAVTRSARSAGTKSRM
jgi:hypothetical protein